jgi:hypothetical protein
MYNFRQVTFPEGSHLRVGFKNRFCKMENLSDFVVENRFAMQLGSTGAHHEI